MLKAAHRCAGPPLPPHPAPLPQGLAPKANNLVCSPPLPPYKRLALSAYRDDIIRKEAGSREEMWLWGRGMCTAEGAGCTGMCLGLVNSFGIGSGKTELSEDGAWFVWYLGDSRLRL